jgi:hypothetical protein
MPYIDFKLLEFVWLRVSVSVRVSSKTHETTVWLQIVKQSKHMGPTIYMRQDHDLLEAVKYCFFTSFNMWFTSDLHCSCEQFSFFFFKCVNFLTVFFLKKLVYSELNSLTL